MEKARILVVDDMPPNLELLSELLSPEYRVNVAMNGLDAIALASSSPQPDLILLDIMMPGMDGYQVCSVLKKKEKTKHIPIIFVTAMGETQNEEKGFALGAVDYVTKPYSPPIVLARVKTHLELYNQTRHLQNLVKERTAELEQARVEAVMANKAKSNFLANMNHELRTPLNGIMGMTQILMSTQPTQEQKEFLEYAHTSSVRLLSMVEDMLDLSNSEAGRIDLTPEDFEVVKSLEHIIDNYRKQASEKGLYFSVSVNDNLPKSLNGDVRKIRQVLINLLNNAIRFTERGGIEVEIAVADGGRDKVALQFTVTDTGVGIPEEQQAHIFEPFSIGEDFMTKKYGGAGLGLTISKNLVTQMGGIIWLASTTDDATSFSFLVPCERV